MLLLSNNNGPYWSADLLRYYAKPKLELLKRSGVQLIERLTSLRIMRVKSRAPETLPISLHYVT